MDAKDAGGMISGLRIVVWGAVALCAMGLSLPACARPGHTQQIRVGVLQHDTPFGQVRTEPGTDINLEWNGRTYVLPMALQLYPGFGFRPQFGYTGNFGGARTEEVYAAAAFDLLPSPTYEFRVSVGFAVHDGQLHRDDPDRLALGQRVLFYASFELGFWFDNNGLFAFFQHSSNGFMGGPNDGINNLGIRYGYRF